MGCAAPLPDRFPPTSPAPLEGDRLLDLRLAFHVHTDRSSDSRGSAAELVALARDLGIDVLVLADHDAAPASEMEGLHGDPPVLVVAGQEVGTLEGHLAVLGVAGLLPSGRPAAETIARVQGEGGFSVVSHPTFPGLPWEGGPGAEGLEVYNLATDLVDDFPLWTLFRFGVLAPLDGTLALRTGLGGPGRALRVWDEWLARGPVVGLGACDSHDNHGIGHRDRLRVVTTRVLAERLAVTPVLEALRAGRAYVAMEAIAPVRSFRFEIEALDGRIPMGGTSAFRPPHRAHVRLSGGEEAAPLLVLLRDGAVFDAARARDVLFPVPGPGTYRVEARLGSRLWILSNPIRLEG